MRSRLTEFPRAGLAVTHYPPSVVSARATDWVTEVSTWLEQRAGEIGVVAGRGRGVLRASDDTPEPFRVRIGRRAA